MASVELVPELWLKVIELLRCPRPRPNGANPRSAIHQPSLVACMRVNKLFNTITGPLLYKVIITDHLPSLIYGLFLPRAASGIPSKQELLTYNESLFIELGSKDHASYDWIMRDGQSRWKRVGMDEAGLMELCDRECDSITFSATALAWLPSQRHSVSTGTYLDGQEGLWMREASRKGLGPGKEPQRSYAAREAISLLVDRPVFYCHRVETGPLFFASTLSGSSTIPYSPPHPASPPLPTHRSHSDITIDGPPPVATEALSRWYVRFPPLVTDQDMVPAIEALSHGISRYLGCRERIIKSETSIQQARLIPVSFVNIALYLPSPMLSPRWRPTVLEAVKQIREATYHRLEVPIARINKDVWNIYDMKDAPPCEACGWCTADDL